MATKNTEDHCPGCGGLWVMIGRAHRCSGRLLQKEVPRAEAEKTIPRLSAKGRDVDRTAGLILATGASRKKQVYTNTDDRRAYMREYMRNLRAAKRGKV